MVKKMMFVFLAFAFIIGGFGLVGVQKSYAQSYYQNGYNSFGSGSYGSYGGYGGFMCGYGGCPGFHYNVAMYPYVPDNRSFPPPPSYAYITGCGEAGCNQVWGTPSDTRFHPPVYYNPTPVFPHYSQYWGW